MKKAVFLDRDGVINRKAPEGSYITRWKEFEFLPDVAAAIRNLNHAGLLVIIATNQRCVAKKLLTESGLRKIHQRMGRELERRGAKIDAIYYCPHDEGCGCRKPKPGMLQQAAREHDIDLSASWMIGDSLVDVETGKTAGCKTIWLIRAPSGAAQSCPADATATSLMEATGQIVNGEHSPNGSGQASTGRL